MLKRLDNEAALILEKKKVYGYDWSKDYLSELEEAFPGVAGNLTVIVDGSKRNRGMLSREGNEVYVNETSWLKEAGRQEAVVLILSDYHREAYGTLCGLLPQFEGDLTVYYFVSRETAIEETYRKQYRNRELENIILFRSGPHASSYIKGTDFADNARALFDYMLAEHMNEAYELVWLVKNPEEFGRYRNVKNVSFLSFDWSVSENKEERDRYYRVLCLAKYLFFTDAYGFARNSRSDQVRVQLWHGCGFKTRVNFARCEKRYEYTTVISDLYAEIHQDIYGLREDQMLVTGYAKEDWLFHPDREAWERLGLAGAERYIFWLPTFRTAKEGLAQLNEYDLTGQTGLPVLDSYEKLSYLDRLLESLHTELIIKLHPFQDRSRVGRIHMKRIRVLEHETLVDMDLQINRLLGYADGLISDYSSAAVDYMLLDRPMGFTLDDVEEYGNSRGFVFENIRDWLPGKEIFSFEAFCEFVREVGEGRDSTAERRRELKERMHKYGDDRSCKRIVEALGI